MPARTSSPIFGFVLLAGPSVHTIFVRLTVWLYLGSESPPNYLWRYLGGSQRLSFDWKPRRTTNVA
jgi:hypothetical protein